MAGGSLIVVGTGIELGAPPDPGRAGGDPAGRQTALGELWAWTFGADGGPLPGRDVVGPIWRRAVREGNAHVERQDALHRRLTDDAPHGPG
jgi:hypothetical protein